MCDQCWGANYLRTRMLERLSNTIAEPDISPPVYGYVSEKLADSPNTFAGFDGGVLGELANVPALAVVPLDEINLRPPSRVTSQDGDGILIESLSDGPRGATGLIEEATAKFLPRSHDVYDERWLSNPLPETTSLDMGGTGEANGDEFLNAPREPLGVDRHTLTLLRKPPETSSNKEAGGTDGRKLAELSSHEASVEDPRDELQARRGRFPMKQWIFIDQNAGKDVVVETCWLPGDCDTERVLGSEFTRGEDGRYRAYFNSDEFTGLNLGSLLKRIANAFCLDRDYEEGGGVA